MKKKIVIQLKQTKNATIKYIKAKDSWTKIENTKKVLTRLEMTTILLLHTLATKKVSKKLYRHQKAYQWNIK